MKRRVKARLREISGILENLRLELEGIAAQENSVQEEYPTDSREYEEHGYNVASIEDAASYLKDSMGQIRDSLEYEDPYEE